MSTRIGATHYPRHGERVAPATLRTVLLEPVPERFHPAADGRALRLCDLDEHVWDRLPRDAIAELSELVVDRVNAGCVRKTFQDTQFPHPPEGVALGDLRLEHRTHLCLSREGFDKDFGSLGELTIGQLLGLRAFGPRCLVDLLSALETLLARKSVVVPQMNSAAARLAALEQAARVRSDDPRFGKLIRSVDVEAATALDLAQRLLNETHVPPDPVFAAGQVEKLCDALEGAASMTVEEELIGIFATGITARNRDILLGYYGWLDGKRHTLSDIGDRFGITRERTRQICAKLTRKHGNLRAVFAPVMERVLTFIKQRTPCSVERLEAELVERGFTKIGLEVEGILDSASLLERQVGFALEWVGMARRRRIGLVVAAGDVDLVSVAVEVARRELYYHGVATLDRIHGQVSERVQGPAKEQVVRRAVEALPGFVWLDEKQGWFRVASISKHGLPKTVEKVLAVAGEVQVAVLREAISRNRRLWREPPPDHVLLAFCRQMPSVRVDGNRIIGNPPKDWRKTLTGVEAELVRTLMEHGPVMDRGQLEDLCVTGGMNRFSFHAFLAWSPVIAQLGHSVYGLLGARASTKQLRSLSARRRAERLTHRVLVDHGRTDDGRVWLRYRLSKAASTYAVITIPAALKDVVCGRFELLDSEGLAIGALATKDGRAWGLGAFLRRQGAQIDDAVVVTLDLDRRTATAMLCSLDAPPPGPVA
ncbi:MAG: sigma factor-like helix-turn-helix DNA-binding protein [Patescibacteria group bacterium]|nr:sigma factor-like helix-turn-helix DNA-binding protein [Patescibacteria group bacterium]